jgi:spore germination cell wall hydrolase CwlJ-like protein
VTATILQRVKTHIVMLKSAVLCLALASYHEARSEPIAAQIAVQKILQHRAISHATSVCKALAMNDQFSFYKRYHVVPKPVNLIEKCAWSQAKNIALSLIKLQVKGITKDHLYFNETRLGKRYETKTKPVKIGKLLFY